MQTLSYRVELQEDDDNVTVTFPDFPGSTAHGDTVSSAVHNAVGCLETRIKCMLSAGEPIPQANTVDSDTCDTVALSPEFTAYLEVPLSLFYNLEGYLWKIIKKTRQTR